MPTIEEYERELAGLRAQLALLRAAPRAVTGTLAAAGSVAGTIAGLEEMVLLVGGNDEISFVNGPMARLLGAPEARAVHGTPLSRWEDALPERLLVVLVQIARATNAPHVLERECPELPPGRLQGTHRTAGGPVLRFTATCSKGKVQVVAQDVTRLRWLEATFSRYVSPAVISQLEAVGTEDLLLAERRELTVLFGDLRGFTSLSQELPPEEVHETVNSFLATMVACVEELDGTIDKFVGDEVMAVFGAPVRQPDHALRALVCAAQMQRRHRVWMVERAAAGRPARPLGIGLATGPVVVGNVGTPTRMDYTVLGHTVNLAARLCGSAAAGEILTIPVTHAAALPSVAGWAGRVPVPRLAFQPHGRLPFKNVAEPVEVVSVVVRE